MCGTCIVCPACAPRFLLSVRARAQCEGADVCVWAVLVCAPQRQAADGRTSQARFGVLQKLLQSLPASQASSSEPQVPPRGAVPGAASRGWRGQPVGGAVLRTATSVGRCAPSPGGRRDSPIPAVTGCWSISIRNGVRGGERGVSAPRCPRGDGSSGAGLEAPPGRCREEEEEGAGGAGGRARPGNEGRRVGCCSQPLPSPPQRGPETCPQEPHPASQNPAAGAALGSFARLPPAFYSVPPFRFILSWQSQPCLFCLPLLRSFSLLSLSFGTSQHLTWMQPASPGLHCPPQPCKEKSSQADVQGTAHLQTLWGQTLVPSSAPEPLLLCAPAPSTCRAPPPLPHSAHVHLLGALQPVPSSAEGPKSRGREHSHCAPRELPAVSSTLLTAPVPSPAPSSHQHQGTLPALNIQLSSPSVPCEGVQHHNEPAGLPVPCAGGTCLGWMLRASLLQKQLGGDESHVPQHMAEQWPWGPGSPSSPLAALLCICMLQCGVQLSLHLTPRRGSGQEMLPLPYPHFPPALKYQLACSLSCLLSSD